MDPGCKAGWGSGSESALKAQAPPKVRVTKLMLAMDFGKPSFVLDQRHVFQHCEPESSNQGETFGVGLE